MSANVVESPVCYADRAAVSTVSVVENQRIARDTYRVRFAAPTIAAALRPGQFLMLRLAGRNDPLLARPFAFYDIIPDASGQPCWIDVVYLVVGRMTSRLAECRPGDLLEVWGPLGNGFPACTVDELILTAGGIGQTPFLAVAKAALGLCTYGNEAASATRAKRVVFLYGARSAEYLAGVTDFEKLGVTVQVSTDDGTAGHHGRVTDLLTRELARPATSRMVYCCGPEKMMEAVAEVTHRAQVPCMVSLETPMACGIGICFSCVTKVRQPAGDWDYRRTCVEGPVFAAESIVW